MPQAQKVGTEFLVNTQTANSQFEPTITGLTNGGFVVSWSDTSGTLGDADSYSIKAQVFTAAGAKVGGEFLVNTQTAGNQQAPTITGLADGGFVVSWQDASGTLGDASATSIKAQMFSAAGVQVGGEFLVNTQTAGNQQAPTITGLADGGFVVSWYDESGTLGDASGSGIKAQVFGADGAKVGGEFLVNTQTANDQYAPTITGLADGGFVVSWWDTSGTLGDASFYGVKAQVFSAAGAKVGAEFLVNTQTAYGQLYPTITGLADGGFVVSWIDESGTLGDDSRTSIKAQVFSAVGAKVGAEFLVNTQTAGVQYAPTITGLADGGFVVSWHDYSGTLGDDSSFTSIKAQAFSAAGAKVGSEFLVNTQTANGQYEPTITGLADGNFVVSWYDESGTLGDASGNSIKAQVFSLDTTPPAVPVVSLAEDTGSSPSDGITSLAALSISGLENGATLLYSVDGGAASATYDPAALSSGQHLVSVTQTDPSGNVSEVGTVNFTLADDALSIQKVGGEFLVNTQTANLQSDPTITGLAGGGFVVSWSDTSGTLGDDSVSSIKAQVFDAAGAKVGGEFLVNAQTTDRQSSPTITGLADGGFVVSWDDNSGTLGDDSVSSIKAQVFDAAGAKVGDEFLVNTQTTYNQIEPTIAGLGNGGFVVSWYDLSGTLGDTSFSSIKAQVFSAAGAKVGSEVLVNTQTASYQDSPRITGLADGGFVVSWVDLSGTLGDDSFYSIKAQVFGAAGDKVGGEFLVNTQTADGQDEPTITGLADGGFVVSWRDFSRSLGDASNASIKAQVFDAAGTKVGEEVLVNTQTASNQYAPTITSLADGGFVVSWQDGSGTLGDADGTSIKAQVFSAAGDKVGGEFLVNTQVANDQLVPTIAGLADGGFVVSWQDGSGTLGDASGFSIKAQIFSLDTTPPAAPIVSLAEDTGPSPTDGITANAALSISGLEDGATLLYSVDGGAASATYDPAALSSGQHLVSVTQTDLSGNVSEAGRVNFTLADDALSIQKVGGEFLVNTQTANYQLYPTITGLVGGGFVVSWEDYSVTLGDTSGTSIKAQVFSAAGAKVGGEFLVNTQTTGNQERPTITGLVGGGFVVSWSDTSGTLGDASETSIKAQVFDAAGAKVGDEFLVNTQTANGQLYQTITGLADGGFVVSWEDTSGTLGDAEAYSIKAQVFSAAGAKVGTEFLVNTQTASSQLQPTITGLADGGFVVSWEDTSGTLGDAEAYSIKAQAFSAAGAKVGTEFLVNTQTASSQLQPTITGLAGGGFVVSWYDFSGTLGDASGAGIKAQVFDAAGIKVGAELLVNTQTAGDQYGPTITSLADGSFVVSWYDFSGTLGDADAFSVKAQVFSAAGAKVGGEFLVNTQIADSQYGPTIASLTDGGFVVSWIDASGTLGDADAYSIKAQIFSLTTGTPTDTTPPTAPVVSLAEDTGLSATDRITANAALSVAGLENGATLLYTVDGGAAAATYDPSALADGQHTVSVTQTDAAGNVSEAGSVVFTLDRIDDAPTGSVRVSATVGATIVALRATQDLVDPDAPTSPVTLRWQSSADGLTWTDIAGATGASYLPPESLPGQFYRAVGIYTDAFGEHSVASVETIHIGGGGNETLAGTQGNDVLSGFLGDDTLSGGGGNDRLDGGDGADSLFGGDGDDTLLGGAGNDTLEGGIGVDRLEGGTGSDILRGGDGADRLLGGAGTDTLEGGAGNDQLYGETGDDTLDGGAGNDFLHGDGGNDTLRGGDGNDTLEGLGDDDTLYGGADDDTLNGGSGADTLYGEAGNDRLNGGTGIDRLEGGAGNDTYVIDDLLDTVAEIDNALGGGSDSVFASVSYTLTAFVETLNLVGTGAIDATGNALGNRIIGNAGNNVIAGLGGQDTINGGLGADTFAFLVAEAGSRDRILDFSAAQGDRVGVDDAFFGLTPGQPLADSRFVSGANVSQGTQAGVGQFLFNTTSHVLSWDADGSGAGAAVALATFDNATLTANDFLIV